MPDSILFTSLYNYEDIEQAYTDMFMRVGNIVSQFYSRANKVEKIVLCITGKDNFKKKLSDTYKANRKPTELSSKVSELKKLLWTRLNGYNFKGTLIDTKIQIVSSSIYEADEIVLYLNKYKNYYIASIDSDIHLASTNQVFNYKKFEFTSLRTERELNRSQIIQSISGNHNNVSGIKGKGIKFADKFLSDGVTFGEYVDLFDSNEEMLLMNRLVSTLQFDSNFKLKLLEVEDIESMFINAVSGF